MKNALILHGTDGSSRGHWFPWLKSQLEAEGYRVWVPDLPGADRPNAKRYTEFLMSNNDWQFNDQRVIIGHSSGAVEILNLLQALPEGTKIRLGILVGSFSSDLAKQPEWNTLTGLFETTFDFELIKNRAEKLVFFHSDNDPYCPIEQAKYLADQTSSEFIILPGKGHFSSESNPPVMELPEILPLINAD